MTSATSAWANSGLIIGANDVDRKSTRLNSSHSQISYAVFCLKKKKQKGAPASSPKHTCRAPRFNALRAAGQIGSRHDAPHRRSHHRFDVTMDHHPLDLRPTKV